MSIILGIFLIIVNALFNGFILMGVYELAFMPFLQIICNPPTIQYTVFILVGMGINICRKHSSIEYKEYKIYKNRLIKIALDELGVTNYDAKYLDGTTSVAFGEDEVGAATVLYKAIKEFNILETIFGISR